MEVSPEFLDVFHFDILEGDTSALTGPNKAFLPESMARKLFGKGSATGKLLISNNSSGKSYTIGGVFKDFPGNSSLRNVIYLSMNPNENYNEWGNWNYLFYVRLDDPANREDVVANFKKNFNFQGTPLEGMDREKDEIDFRLTSLPDLHFLKNVDFDPSPKASRQVLLVLITIAFIILIIAGINFTNFSTALVPMRIKSINTRKVLGSSDNTLRLNLLLESVGASVAAYLISLGLLYWVSKTFIASFVDADMSFSLQYPILLQTALLAILLGMLSGIYPALYITSFPPALVLKGSFGLSPKGRTFRNVLVGIQFVASFALIIGSLFMYLQNHYMQHAPVGYDKDAVIIVGLNDKINKSRDAFGNQLKLFSGIEDVTYSRMLLSSADNYMGWGREYGDKSITFQCLPVSPTFLKVMGIQVKEGRDFRPEDGLKETGVYIFNEKARTAYDLKLNETINNDEIVGFIPDIKFASFRMEVSPMAFYVWGKQENQDTFYSFAYIKMKAGSDFRAAMDHVRSVLSSLDSEYPFNVRFYDEVLQKTYEKEVKISSLISLFSLIAIFISIVGVFGLVVFESEYKKKEIGIRKVLGSSTGQILMMFNTNYLNILVICFILAAPMAYYAVKTWLENFAYRTPVYAWVFVVAFLIVAFITIITVTFQNWSVANENPVNNVKNE